MLKKYEWVRQDDIKDCGVCSLLIIIKTYGGGVSKEYLRELTKTTKEGTTAFHLLEAGRKLGFNTNALKGDILELDKRLLPCIAHVVVDKKYQHFVVVMNINKKKGIITISDPAEGIIKYKLEEYNKISTNQYLVFIPNKKIPNLKKNNEVFNNIFETIIQYKHVFISIFIFSLLYTLVSIITAFNFQIIIDHVLTYSSKNNLNLIIFIFIFLYILKSIIDLTRNNLLVFINHTLDNKLIMNIYSHIISLPYLFYKNRTTGEIISRINDLSDVKESISRLFMTFFVDLVLIIFVFFTLYNISPSLTLIGIIMIIMYLIVIKIFNKFFKYYINKNQEDAAIVNSYLIESINNVDTIKSLGLEKISTNKLYCKYNNYLNSSYKFQKLFNLENFIKDIVNYIGTALIIFVGTIFVLEEKMSLGELITYNGMIIYFLEPIKNIIEMELVIKKSKISINRVTELYEVEKEEMEIDKKYNGNKLKGNIKINNLDYSYNGRKNIFEGINLQIDSGKKIMIYGNSGSGKSTIGKILMKFLNIERDKVFIDNKDINDYNVMDIRREICYIGQNENLFSDTIYNNIVLDRDVDYDKFLNIADITKVDEIVKKNVLSYEMLLEENGFNISGGEKQRIILARSLLKESSIYVLDEALNQVDVEKEREILKNVFNYLDGKTVIYISHRFDNSDMFDNKINMEKIKYA
ncbi:MAG: peptidase domain-containing ABC transporter [Bacilli bacterium]|nr:peptidase domain-containing ABC transporter [Bacilli bacterium]